MLAPLMLLLNANFLRHMSRCLRELGLFGMLILVQPVDLNSQVTQDRNMPTPSLRSLQAALQRLSLEQKRTIAEWLAAAIAAEETATVEIPEKANSVGTERHHDGKTYQLEKRRCGRAGCRCMSGDVAEVGHGPYWYAYWKEHGKMRSQYVGKRVPWEGIP